MSDMVSYWMPAPFNSMECGNPEAPCRVGAVKGFEGQELNREVYLNLLAIRMQELVDNDDPERNPYTMENLLADLEHAELIEPDVETVQQILEESGLQWRLSILGVTGRVPATFPKNNPRAERIYKETDLESWASSLLEHPPNEDR
jgi:hypothetical protein